MKREDMKVGMEVECPRIAEGRVLGRILAIPKPGGVGYVTVVYDQVVGLLVRDDEIEPLGTRKEA